MKTILGMVLLVGLPVVGTTQEELRAYIPYAIPDGTPPPPAPPKPFWVVPVSEIISQKTHVENGRTITVRQIRPIGLPAPPAPAVPTATPGISADLGERMDAYREKHPHHQIIALGATVFRLENGDTRTLARIHGFGGGGPATIWSSGDFSLLSGIGVFTDNQGASRALFMSWSIHDTIRIAERLAETSRESKPPPSFHWPCSHPWARLPRS